MKPVLIGIAGGSASGKTLLSMRLKDAFEKTKSIVIIRQDDYYHDQAHLSMEARLKTNYDHPFAFDNKRLVGDLDRLLHRQSIEKPVYDFVEYTRSDKVETIQPADVIILEGLFVLEDEMIRNRCDIKVFVDAQADIRFIRRLVRDVHQRGRSLDSVVDQYTSTVRVMHEQFIEPSKRFADIIVPQGGKNEVAVDLLTTKISSIIEKNML
ncbi:MAG: uridine kinase [Erysipelothrix sp.]|jgi:uridine kinase|nr:uridine kinase [Erysipelothrix sp.]